MPRISHFYGIAVYMYYRDHAPPHFHAIYGEHEATIDIERGQIADGSLPRRARVLVEEWAQAHREALRQNWELARQGRPLEDIEPLE
jgi:hypothetical protein